MHPEAIRAIETELLIEAIKRRWGFDLGEYGQASLRRRIARAIEMLGAPRISTVLERVLYDEAFYRELVSRLAVSVTEFFRDSLFFAALRRLVLPCLATYPRVTIWHPGCATGEEVYSMAILLKEAQLLGRSQIYATDINLDALATARAGVYPLKKLEEAEKAHERAGGRAPFRDYYVTRVDPTGGKTSSAILSGELRERIIWSEHNLCRDEVFAETHLIVCRNTLIYFSPALQDRVVGRFRRSLLPHGILALGSKESLDFNASRSEFELLDADQRIYRAAARDFSA
jgi:chemotaxis protein methyltransferase CheR